MGEGRNKYPQINRSMNGIFLCTGQIFYSEKLIADNKDWNGTILWLKIFSQRILYSIQFSLLGCAEGKFYIFSQCLSLYLADLQN